MHAAEEKDAKREILAKKVRGHKSPVEAGAGIGSGAWIEHLF